MNSDEYIVPKYETITAEETRRRLEMVNSGLIYALNRENNHETISVLRLIAARLEEQNG